mmetsp:Transcript_5431/g.22966  ORF Transcript_5431/g.22966 Transcript_5431/m.22966 type:complete len:279 (-) Transcript_5431:391-1227(-)
MASPGRSRCSAGSALAGCRRHSWANERGTGVRNHRQLCRCCCVGSPAVVVGRRSVVSAPCVAGPARPAGGSGCDVGRVGRHPCALLCGGRESLSGGVRGPRSPAASASRSMGGCRRRRRARHLRVCSVRHAQDGVLCRGARSVALVSCWNVRLAHRSHVRGHGVARRCSHLHPVRSLPPAHRRRCLDGFGPRRVGCDTSRELPRSWCAPRRPAALVAGCSSEAGALPGKACPSGGARRPRRHRASLVGRGGMRWNRCVCCNSPGRRRCRRKKPWRAAR